MSDSLAQKLIRVVRSDIGSVVCHFTKPRYESIDDLGDSFQPGEEISASQVLQEIVKSMTLKGESGYVKGNFKVVSFTEAPLHELARFFAIESHIRDEASGNAPRRYYPYGIGMARNKLWLKGGRQVWYGEDNDYTSLPKSLRWKYVNFTPPNIDFCWEREWRHKGDLKICEKDAFLIVPDVEAKKEILNQVNSSWKIIVLEDFVSGTIS